MGIGYIYTTRIGVSSIKSDAKYIRRACWPAAPAEVSNAGSEFSRTDAETLYAIPESVGALYAA
jgi:hypothetical protein